MNFIFLTDNSYNENNAVFNICRTIASTATANGDRVVIVGSCEEKDVPRQEVVEGIEYRRFFYPINPITRKILNEYAKSHNLLRLATAMLFHPICGVVGVLRKLFGFNPILRRYRIAVEQLFGEGYDASAIISFSAPYYTTFALSKMNVECKKIGYMCDPYYTHYIMGGRRALMEEKKTLSRLDHIFIAKTLKDDYFGDEWKRYENKISFMDFPCVAERETGEAVALFDKERINCLYCGNFYVGLRSPEYLFRLLFAANNDAILVTIIGETDSACDGEALALREELVKRGLLRLLPATDAKTAYAAMNAADILVNIGNEDVKMLPSKLFDYISTGLPIVNIQNDGDITSDYVSRYPFGLSLSKTSASVAANARIFQEFCLDNAGKRAEFSEINELFYSATPKCAIDEIYRVVCGC